MSSDHNFLLMQQAIRDKDFALDLLEKYMTHVVRCEGIDFLDRIGEPMSGVEFTEREIENLKAIRERIKP